MLLHLEEQFKDHHRGQDPALLMVLPVGLLDIQIVEGEAGCLPAGLGEEVSAKRISSMVHLTGGGTRKEVSRCIYF